MVKDDCISFYTSNGYALLELSAYVPGQKSAGKIPLRKHWQDTKYDPLFDCYGNFGVVLAEEDLVIDIDPRNGGQIPPFLQNVNTLTVKTGGGGWHYYFKKDPGIEVVSGLKKFPGVEFKTKGNQVVGAGSVTQAEYIFTNRTPAIPCPFLDLISRAENNKKTTSKPIEYVNDEQTQSRFLDFLDHCPVAVSGQSGDLTTFNVACHGRDLGLDQATTSRLMSTHYNPRCLPPWPMEELILKVDNAYKYAKNDVGVLSPKAEFDQIDKNTIVVDDKNKITLHPIDKEAGVTGWEYSNKAGKLKDSFRNTLNALLLPKKPISGLLKFNEFSEQIEFTRKTPWNKDAKEDKFWTDNDAVMLKAWISDNHNFAPSIPFIHEAALVASKKKTYHPIRDYLHGLKWDGKERIENWMVEYLKAEDCLYIRTIGKIVLCAAVRRIFNPGEKFDYLMVLEGAQRIGKSRVCEALGGEFHIGLRLDPHNKDMVAYMQSKWIVEIEEMDFATKSEAKAIKAFLSRRTDRIRVAYGRVPQDYPRQSVFIGTYNPLDGESQYLNDPTGNTRFWPVVLPDQKIDVERVKADRDQLWAEAVVKSKECKLYLDTALETVLADIQHVKKELDVWQETIEPWLVEKNISFITATGLYTQCLGGVAEKFTAFDGRRIGNVMRNLGWERMAGWDREKQNSVRGFRKVKIDVDKSDIDDILET